MRRGVLVWIVAAIVAGLYVSFKRSEVRALRKELRDVSVRLAEAEERVDTFIIRDSIPVVETRVVEVDRTDYKKLLADERLIKDLKLRVRDLESENRTLLSTRDTVVLTTVDDSVYSYRDQWCRFSYVHATGVLDWEVRDSLCTYVSAEYRHRFLWWKWGRKGYKVSIVNFNPRSRIEYEKYIRLR